MASKTRVTAKQPKHVLADQCPRCRKMTFCEHCNQCDACKFEPRLITSSTEKCPDGCPQPYCGHCQNHVRHGRRCPLAMVN
jgi:hypothetical protein